MIEYFNAGETTPSTTYKHGVVTIGAFIDSRGVDRSMYILQPIEVIVNGQYIPSTEWDLTVIYPDSKVQVYGIPGGGIIKGIGNILSGILNLAFGWILPSAKGAGRRYDSGQGRQLDPANIKANSPRLGETVPEYFGRYRIYLDYVTMPRRYFESMRKQVIEFTGCVGVGRYQINQNEIRISDTPVTALGDTAKVILYEPNQSLAADPVHLNWYTAEEVGGTSSGTAGLILGTDIGNRTNTNPPSYTFDGLIIKRPSGSFPPAWGQGTVITITYPRTYTVTTELIGIQQANVFEGFFGHTVNGFTAFGGYSSSVIEDLGGGYKRVYFYYVDEQSNVIYYRGEQNGTRAYTFNPNAQWAVDVNSDSELTLQNTGGRFFESDVTVASQIAYESGTVYGEWAGQYYAVPIKQKTRTIEVDFYFPNGLIRLDDNGQSLNRSVTVEVQYRDVNSSTWTSVFYTYTNNSQDQIGFTERISIPEMEPVVRVRRVGVQVSSNQIFDAVQWYGLKSLLKSQTHYPNWTTATVSFESGGKLAVQSENRVNVIGTRILPELNINGVWSEPRPSRSITAALRYITHSIGYTDDDIDINETIRLNNQYWTPRNETFDYGFGELTVKDAIDTVLQAGFSVMTVDHGLIRPVRDDVRTIGLEEQSFAYSDQNVIGNIVEEFKPWSWDDYDGVEVEYIDPDTFEPDVVRYVLDGKLGVKIDRIKLDGVTDRVRAWRWAARMAKMNLYRNKIKTFRTELSGMNARYWSLVSIIVNDPLISQSAIVLGVKSTNDGLLIEASEKLKTESGESYQAAYRDSSGRLVGPFPVLDIINQKTVLLPKNTPPPVIDMNMELPHFYFGKAGEITEPCLVQSIVPQGLKEADLTVVNYDSRIYSDDNNFPDEVR